MESLRAFFFQHRALTGLLVAAALLMKIAVPTGMMIGTDASHTITVTICHDATGDVGQQQVSIPIKTGNGEMPSQPGKGECPYAALSMASLSSADIVLLAAALAFIIALGFQPTRIAPLPRPGFILPPLRGPPART